MTEQLMDNISNEEHERLISISEHAIASPLSPAAQAVVDAIESRIDRCAAVAAALRVVADQVTPSDAIEPRNYLPMAIECQRIRAELLAIAAELEDQ
jgi:hypothetical protein